MNYVKNTKGIFVFCYSDIKGVEMRHSRHSSKYLLAEDGDGSEADMLGTTPPRARNRDKEKRR